MEVNSIVSCLTEWMKWKSNWKLQYHLVLVDCTAHCTVYIEYFIIQSDVEQKIFFE